MCGRSLRGYGPDLMAWRRSRRARAPRRHAAWERRGERRRGWRGEGRRAFGFDAEGMGPGAKMPAFLAVLALAALLAAPAAMFVLSVAPQFFWLFFVFGWMLLPAFGALVRGVAGLVEGRRARPALPSAKSRERELLEALRDHGELTPARAAMETSLSVAEADEMLKGLVEGGHLEVRVRGGGLFYALWETGAVEAAPDEETAEARDGSGG